MKVTLLNDSINIENIDGVYEQIYTFINKTLENKEAYFSHMIIDGVEIYNDFELYIEEKLKDIKEIEIEVRTATEFIQDIIVSIQQYAEGAIPELKQLSDNFYLSSQPSSWEKLSDLIEGIQWIHGSITSIDREKNRPINWDRYLMFASSLETFFPNLLEALEAQDNILIADIISYEIIPLFENLKELNSNKDVKVGRDSSHAEEKH